MVDSVAITTTNNKKYERGEKMRREWDKTECTKRQISGELYEMHTKVVK